MAFGQSAMQFAATINDYIRRETDATKFRRILLAKLESSKRIVLNCEGPEREWPVRYKRSPMHARTAGQVVVFQARNKHKRAKLPPRSYIVTQSITDEDKQINKGKAAIVKIWANAIKDAVRDIREQFGEELFVADGNAAGQTNRIHGFASCLAASVDPNNAVGITNDIYGGLSTQRGLTGTWNGAWPLGNGDPQYQYWSPLVVDYTSTSNPATHLGWTATTKNWANNCIEATRFAISAMQRYNDAVDMFLFDWNMHRLLKEKAQTEERLVVERGQDVGLSKLGFKGINIDGVDTFHEVGVPEGHGYGLALDNLELCSWHSQLFKSLDTFDHETLSDNVSVRFFGNLFIESPRRLCQLIDLT